MARLLFFCLHRKVPYPVRARVGDEMVMQRLDGQLITLCARAGGRGWGRDPALAKLWLLRVRPRRVHAFLAFVAGTFYDRAWP